jgi:hypothetical protein
MKIEAILAVLEGGSAVVRFTDKLRRKAAEAKVSRKKTLAQRRRARTIAKLRTVVQLAEDEEEEEEEEAELIEQGWQTTLGAGMKALTFAGKLARKRKERLSALAAAAAAAAEAGGVRRGRQHSQGGARDRRGTLVSGSSGSDFKASLSYVATPSSSSPFPALPLSLPSSCVCLSVCLSELWRAVLTRRSSPW